jgi:MEMO1 family protein
MNSSKETLLTREPAVAGQFYPGNPNGLRDELQRLFAGVKRKALNGNTLAIISPHAGYIYSGAIAATAFMQIDPEKEYENVFVIGSSHRYAFNGASVFTQGNYQTPLGVIPVNIKLSRELMSVSNVFTNRSDAQINEHSLEVQLPFLQYRLKKPFQIVPIVISTQHSSVCQKIAISLLPYFTPDNLFIISTDFSHYPGYEDACRVDRLTADAIITGDPEVLLKSLEKNEHDGIPGLSTCLCGWTSVLTLLYMTEKMPGIHYTLVDYKNSGDAAGSDNKSRVVGYYAISVRQDDSLQPGTDDNEGTMLTAEDKKVMMTLVHDAIRIKVTTGKQSNISPENLSPALSQHAGVFVSLYRQGKLRGCIGRFTPDLPLYQLVQEMAVASALYDHRFSPLKSDELPEIRVEISVLTPLKKIDSIDEIELGRHGIYLKKGSSSGTFLPQVATNTGWSKEEFLEHCASDKAGIGRNGWKEAELYTYEAIIIKEEI